MALLTMALLYGTGTVVTCEVGGPAMPYNPAGGGLPAGSEWSTTGPISLDISGATAGGWQVGEVTDGAQLCYAWRASHPASRSGRSPCAVPRNAKCGDPAVIGRRARSRPRARP